MESLASSRGPCAFDRLAARWTRGGLGGSLAGALKSSATLGLTDAQLGISSSFYLAGAVLGAFTFGYLADRFGRKRLFTWTLLLYVCAATATGFFWNLFSFTFFRVLTGAGIGGEYAAINSAVDEVIPARLRGRIDLSVAGGLFGPLIFGRLAGSGSRRVLFGGYLCGALVMIVAGISQARWGVAAERKTLESLVIHSPSAARA